MSIIKVEADQNLLAKQAAELSIQILARAIESYGQATWVLAGGTAPTSSYNVIADEFNKRLDWSKVWFILGDERSVSEGSDDSNWEQIEKVLLTKLPIDDHKALKPMYYLSNQVAAQKYNELLKSLPKNDNSLPRFDLVWLGIGEDGHTLSLFPGQDSTNDEMVIAIFNSPKPPPERISLSLRALTSTSEALVLAVGSAKAEVLTRLKQNDDSMPIVKAIKTIEDNGGKVTIFTDQDA